MRKTYSNGADNSKNKGQGVGGTVAAILLLTGVVALIITIATASARTLWTLVVVGIAVGAGVAFAAGVVWLLPLYMLLKIPKRYKEIEDQKDEFHVLHETAHNIRSKLEDLEICLMETSRQVDKLASNKNKFVVRENFSLLKTKSEDLHATFTNKDELCNQVNSFLNQNSSVQDEDETDM